MDESIHKQLIAGQITALTLDTSVFDRNGLALESGLLTQLEQFHVSDIELLIANTVANEVKRHLARNSSAAIKALQGGLTQTQKHRALAESDQEELATLIGTAVAGDVARAHQRFDGWADRVGAEIIYEADYASIQEIMRRYEEAEPPFAETGDKKQEFPDAVALATLEGWAKDYDTKILVVSQDKDWHRYGAQSERLVVVDDLADALTTIVGLGAASEPAEQLSKMFAAGDPLRLEASVLAAIKDQVDKIEFRVEADSQFSVEEDWVEAVVSDIEIDAPAATGPSFDAISQQGDEAVVMVTGNASLDIHVHFSFEKFDSVDRDYIGMGSTVVSDDVEVEFEALVTLRTGASGLEIVRVELLPKIQHVSYYDLEPDWMSDPAGYDED